MLKLSKNFIFNIKDINIITKGINNINSHIKNNTPNNNLFLSLCDLDGIGHKYGTNSIEYKNRLNFLEKHINQLTMITVRNIRMNL